MVFIKVQIIYLTKVRIKFQFNCLNFRKFEKKHLAQIKTVYPTAFIFRQQSNAKKSGYQLTIDFNFDGSQKPKDFKFIESSTLIARQKQFRNALHKITIGHHREYLAKNYPSLSVDDDAIMRWHPCFKLDEVPEIDQSPLPEPPQVKTFSTALDVLGQARLNMTPRVSRALVFMMLSCFVVSIRLLTF